MYGLPTKEDLNRLTLRAIVAYWEKRNVRSLTEELVRWNEQMAGLAGKMKDLLGGHHEVPELRASGG